MSDALPKLIRQYNRAFERERETLSHAALIAAHNVAGHLHSLGGAGASNPTIRQGAVEAIDNFTAVRRQER